MAALGEVKYLTIHCAATPEFRDVKAREIEAWDISKFGQKSYHFICLLDGTIHQSLPLTVRGAHVGKANTGNIGFCYVGGMTKDMKSPKDTRNTLQKAAIRKKVAELQAQFLILKTNDATGKPRTRGHRDWSPDLNHNGKIERNEWIKACPCFDVTTEL